MGAKYPQSAPNRREDGSIDPNVPVPGAPQRAEFDPNEPGSRQMRYRDPAPKDIARLEYPPCPNRLNRQMRYSDESPLNNPTGDAKAPCNCPECLEARGEEVPLEIRKRYDRAMNKRLETK